MSATAPATRYACCFTALDRSGEAHVQFATVQANSEIEIVQTLAREFSLGGRVKHVSLISALELDEEEL